MEAARVVEGWAVAMVVVRVEALVAGKVAVERAALHTFYCHQGNTHSECTRHMCTSCQ